MALEGKHLHHYRILRLIGKGGMGEVYLMEDSRVQRQVAAKFIRLELMQADQDAMTNALHLFWREATAIAQFDHPAILPLYDHGEAVIDDVAVAYLIMPYRPEGSLSTWLRKLARDRQTQQLALKQIAHVIQQAAQGLQHAHDHQVMHLDVKPANFLIRSRQSSDDYPDLLLSDFGIARLTNATSSFSLNAHGTPTYMAPEQWANHPVFASDQYALAIMAYELLTGSPPFKGAPMSVMYAHVQEQPKSVCDHNPLVPPAVDLVLQRALAKKPEERFPSIAAFAHAFQQAFQGMDEATTLRVLRPSPVTPTPQMPGTPAPTGDVRATLVISTEEARKGTVRTLTLANGRAVSVQIPPGVLSDHILTLIGQGEVLGPGITAGNLYLTLSVVEAPMQVSPLIGDAAPTSRSSHPAQSLSPAPVVAPVQEKMTPPSTISTRSVPSAHDAASLSAGTSPQAALPPQNAIVLPPSPPSAPPKHRLSRPMGVLLLVLILVLLGGTVYGAATGRWPWNISQGNTSQWRSQISGTPQNLRSVAWSGSQFVAVGNSGTILTSPDGHTWTAQNTGISRNLSGVAGSGSQFVAVGESGTILTSALNNL